MSEPLLTEMRSPCLAGPVLPNGASDCYRHVMGPGRRFPFFANSRYRPAEATKEARFALSNQMDIGPCVIVQYGCHGFDGRILEDVVQTLKDGNSIRIYRFKEPI